MAVRDRAWNVWKGPATKASRRFMVLTRFALKEVFDSRVFLAFYLLSMLPSALAVLAIYFSHNTQFLEQFGGLDSWFSKIPDWIFLHLFGWQAIPAFLVAVVVAPPLIAADVDNNALGVILARPIGRKDYVLGKGHIVFFKNKLKYLKKRHELLKKEMRRRGFRTEKTMRLSDFPKRLCNDWKPSLKDKELIKERLIWKLNKKPDYYRYCGEKKGKAFFIRLIKSS